jgi:UTP--glucose-1-phosphate uridylyltransferase
VLRPSVADAAFDAHQFDELRAALVRGDLSPERARLRHPPAPLPADACTDLHDFSVEDRAALRRRGEQAIAAGQVAALVLNGGMATRFGGVVKGVVPVVDGRDDLSFLAVKLAALRRAGVPVVLMNSFATAAATREHLAAIDWAGIPAADRLEFSQSLLPHVLADGTPLPTLPDADHFADTLLYAAPGHGDTLRRVRDSGVVAALAARGVAHVLVSNVDNLGATLDPEVLGAHLAAVDRGSAMSVEVVAREPGDAGGCVAAVDGKPVILESFRLPAGTDLADFTHFNTNTLWIALDALRADHPLTWFPVHKKLQWPDGSEREVVQFEQLIGQLSEFVPTSYILVDRDRFLPIKTREDLAAAAPRLASIATAAGLSV